MPISQHDFQAFAEFGFTRISAAPESLTLDDLVVEWESKRQREDINAAIREGLADADAGRIRPADEVMLELRAKHGLSQE